MAKRGKSSKQKKLKRMNSRKVSYKRKGKRITQKYKEKIMRGGGMRAIIDNKSHSGAFFYDVILINGKKVKHEGEFMTIDNGTGVEVISKEEYGTEKLGKDLPKLIGEPGRKGEDHQLVKLKVGHEKVHGGYIYGLVGSDHLDYDIPEPEPAAPAPLTDEEKETKCEEIKKLCMKSHYDVAIAKIEEMRHS